MIEPWRVILDRYPALSRPTSAPEPLGNAGGLSGARLWRFQSGQGPLVARCWPPGGPDLPHLHQIHAWLEQASPLGFVPVPISALDGRKIITHDGRHWEVSPWMPGSANLTRPPEIARIRATYASLAAFHARLGSSRSEGLSPGLASRVTELDRLILGEFDSIQLAIDGSHSDPLAPLATAWLARAASTAPSLLAALRKSAAIPLLLQPCLRDARPDHFLFEGIRLTGLVDFGAMGRDTVAGDLARLMAENPGRDRVARAYALAAYEEIRPLSRNEVMAIGAFERANALLVPGHWVRWRFLDYRHFEFSQAIELGLRRALERMDEAGL